MNRLFLLLRLTPDRENEVRRFIVLFYLVGTIGLVLPWTLPFFQLLIPLALIMSFIILLAYYPGGIDKETATVFGMIAILGFFIEMVGVQTGRIFGEYHYGESLGPLIGGVPPLIGLNWLLVSCMAASVAARYIQIPFWRITAAAGLMTLYDFVLEPVAPELGMWFFLDGLPDLKNYIAWFVIGWVFQWFLVKTRMTHQNSMAVLLFVIQILFFLLILLGRWAFFFLWQYFS